MSTLYRHMAFNLIFLKLKINITSYSLITVDTLAVTFTLSLAYNLIATNKIIISTTNSVSNAYLTLVVPEMVVNIVVITGAVAITIVLSRPTLEAKIF